MAVSATGRGPAGSWVQRAPGGAVLTCQWGHPWLAGSRAGCWAQLTLTSIPPHRLRMSHRDTELTSGCGVSNWTSFQGNAAPTHREGSSKTSTPMVCHTLTCGRIPAPPEPAILPKIEWSMQGGHQPLCHLPGREELQPHLVSPGPRAGTTHPVVGSLYCRPGVGRCVWRGRTWTGWLENPN